MNDQKNEISFYHFQKREKQFLHLLKDQGNVQFRNEGDGIRIETNGENMKCFGRKTDPSVCEYLSALSYRL